MDTAAAKKLLILGNMALIQVKDISYCDYLFFRKVFRLKLWLLERWLHSLPSYLVGYRMEF